MQTWFCIETCQKRKYVLLCQLFQAYGLFRKEGQSSFYIFNQSLFICTYVLWILMCQRLISLIIKFIIQNFAFLKFYYTEIDLISKNMIKTIIDRINLLKMETLYFFKISSNLVRTIVSEKLETMWFRLTPWCSIYVFQYIPNYTHST